MRALACHQYGLSSIPGLCIICGLSLLLVLVFALRGFSPGTVYSGFPLSLKTQHFQFDLDYCKALYYHEALLTREIAPALPAVLLTLKINCHFKFFIQLHSFFFYKNIVFPAQAGYSYFSADVRLKIFS